MACIFKILTSPFLEENFRASAIQTIADILTKLKAQPNQGYKRLMDEVGLSSRPVQMNQNFGQSNMNDRSRQLQQGGNMGHGGGFVPGMSGMDNITPNRSHSHDQFGYQYGVNGYPQSQQGFAPTPQYSNGMNGQAQFQNYATPTGRPQNGYMGNGFQGYNTPPSTVDYRGLSNQSASPVPYNAQMSPMMGHVGFAQSYPQQGGQNQMYGYNGHGMQQNGYGYSPQMQTVHAGGRGRKVRPQSSYNQPDHNPDTYQR